MGTYILYRLVARGLERINTADLLHGERILSRLVVMFQDIPLRLGRAKHEHDYIDLLQDLREEAQHQHLNTWLEWAIASEHEYIANSRALIHRILYVLFVEIRVRAYETGRDELFKLSDLFHNIPLQLERITQDDSTSMETLDWLRERAALRGITSWLEHELQDLQSNAAL